ncbi:MAG: enoyl-CoA hydratase/isomerase family protein [Bacillota bacterium]
MSDIILTKQDGIGTVLINRPHRKNALTMEAYAELTATLQEVGQDKDVKVVVLTGAGNSFCSGDDVKQVMSGFKDQDDFDFVEGASVGDDLFRSCWAMPKPVIAAVDGYALGAGCDLALSCDFIIATTEAKFAEFYIRRALVPTSIGIYLLAKLVGFAKAKEMVLTGKMVDAAEAEKMGLVNKVVERENFEAEIRQMAEELAQIPPKAYALAKKSLFSSLDLDFKASTQLCNFMLNLARKTDEHSAMVAQFLNKK